MNVIHGTSWAYGRGCRCGECREYQSSRVAANRAKRRKNPVSHGTRSSYDAGCRCKACKGARQAAYRGEVIRAVRDAMRRDAA